METPPPETMAYAISLFDLGQAAGSSLRMERELAATLDLLDRDNRVGDFLANPLVGMDGKVDALKQLLGGKVHPVLLHFLQIVLEQGEWRRLRAIADGYFEVVGRRSTHTAAEVTTAIPLTEAQLEALESTLTAKFHRPVKLHARVDASVIGGVSARVGDIIIDGTVSHRLEQVMEALLRV